MLQFENVVGMIEGLLDQSEPHRANAWEPSTILTVGCYVCYSVLSLRRANVMLLGVAKEPRQRLDDLASYLVLNTDKVRDLCPIDSCTVGDRTQG
jgi:hypothetical protein